MILKPSLDIAETVYRGVRFDVRRVELPCPDGRTVGRDIVVHPGSVLIVPVLDREHVVLIRNYRIAAGQALWELPAGTLEPAGEEPLACAHRELIEETGYEAKRMTPLCAFFASPGISNERMHAFVAEDLAQVGQSLDAAEQIVVHVVPRTQALQMVKSGEIADGKTIAGLLYYDMLVRSGG